MTTEHYSIQQLSAVTSCQLVYQINMAHSADWPHTHTHTAQWWLEVTMVVVREMKDPVYCKCLPDDSLSTHKNLDHNREALLPNAEI